MLAVIVGINLLLDSHVIPAPPLPQELEGGVPTPQRVRAMKELHEIVATKRLEEVSAPMQERVYSGTIANRRPSV